VERDKMEEKKKKRKEKEVEETDFKEDLSFSVRIARCAM
jgi:hypothetical protein